jgi:hypothetical protein
VGVLGPYELVDRVPVDSGCVGAAARLQVMGDSGCGDKASIAEGAGHLLASVKTRLEMLGTLGYPEVQPTDEEKLVLTILILLWLRKERPQSAQ